MIKRKDQVFTFWKENRNFASIFIPFRSLKLFLFGIYLCRILLTTIAQGIKSASVKGDWKLRLHIFFEWRTKWRVQGKNLDLIYAFAIFRFYLICAVTGFAAARNCKKTLLLSITPLHLCPILAKVWLVKGSFLVLCREKNSKNVSMVHRNDAVRFSFGPWWFCAFLCCETQFLIINQYKRWLNQIQT